MKQVKIKVAKTAGFCFGVNRAIKLCGDLLDSGKSIATLGPIIHNEDVVSELGRRGAKIVENPLDAGDRLLVIRSHGVGRGVFETCRQSNIQLADATCPFVSHIHRIVSGHTGENAMVFIIGDESHPEVAGIIGHCSAEYRVFRDFEQLSAQDPSLYIKNNILMVAQTTFNLLQYKKCVEYVSGVFPTARCCFTVCEATMARQEEAAQLAKESDACIVIGGRHSSNTKKLLSVCTAGCSRSFLIENAAGLSLEMLCEADVIGVTAGASTPASIIEEVLNRMSDIIKEQSNAPVEENDGELNFAEAVENYLGRAARNKRYVGVVTSVLPNEVIVDIGTKQTGVVPADEMTNDSSANLADLVKKGDKLNLVVIKVNDQEGIVTLSKKRLDSEAGFAAVSEACEANEAVEGTVTEKVPAGIVVNVGGVRVFVHDSQTGLARGEDAESLLKTKVRLKITDAKSPRSVRGSIRRVQSEELAVMRNAFWSEVEDGKQYHGVVKSIMPYGIFVDLGGVDGMVHVSELSWGRVRNPGDIVKIGDEIDVYVKSTDKENRKISLGYKKEDDNPWNQLREAVPGTIFEGPVVSMVKYGAFVRILPGLDGFVHISQISKQRIEKPQDVLTIGQVVQARLLGVDFDRQRISLSLRDENEKPEPKKPQQRELSPEEIEQREIDDAVKQVNAEDPQGKSAIQEALEKAQEKADEIADNVKEIADKAEVKAKKVKEAAADKLEDVAKDVKEAVGKVAAKAKKVKEAAADKLEDVVDGIKDELGGDNSENK